MIVDPDPRRMIEGLRDTGYEFETAVADLIDNCIAAAATKISIRVSLDLRGNPHFSIADNGTGMNEKGLLNAMKYGASERPNPASLGKYGLGLKTASTAFCRRLSVTSQDSSDAQPLCATWDLDHVCHEGKWDLLYPDELNKEALSHLDQVAVGSSGTVVTWTKVDRLMKAYANPNGAFAQKGLQKKVTGLAEHIARHYQRFLDFEDGRAPNIEIWANGVKIVAWDPFMSEISEVVASETMEVEVANGETAKFSVTAFVLPRREEFPSDDLFKTANISIARQGIYIYREQRLIVDADWLGLYSKEPHSNLLRVEFSFDHKLDEAFHLDIMKSQIILNDVLWKWLAEEFLPAPRREANIRYRKGVQKQVSDQSKGAHDTSNKNIGNREAAAGGASVTTVDADENKVEVTNPYGKFQLKIPVSDAFRPGEVYIQPVDSIANRLLFEPALIEQHRAVRLNTSHPYYHKVYVPNLNNSVTLQGMDSLMWALCVAELTTMRDETAEHFNDMRYELSRLLAKLVDNLPDPEEEVDEA